MASGVDLLGAAPLGAQGAGAGATTYKNAQAAGSISVGASFAIGKLNVGTISASISVTSSNSFGKDIIATPSAATASVTGAAVVQRIIHAPAATAATASVIAPAVAAGVMQFPIVAAANIATIAAQPEMQRRRFTTANAAMAVSATGAAGRLEKTTAGAAVAITTNASASVELIFSGSLQISVSATAAPRATFSPAISSSFSVLAPAVDGLRIFTISPTAASTDITTVADAQRVRPSAASAISAITAQAVAGLAPPVDIAASAALAVTAQAQAGKLATTSAVTANLSAGATASARIIRIDLMAGAATTVVSCSAVPRAIRFASAAGQMSMTSAALQTSKLAVTGANIAVTVSAGALAGFFRDGQAATTVSCVATATGRLLWEPVAAAGADPWAAVNTSGADPWTPQSGGNVETPADIWQTAA